MQVISGLANAAPKDTALLLACGRKFGAGNETRTRDPDLGKVVLYQLSYSRFKNWSSQYAGDSQWMQSLRRGPVERGAYSNAIAFGVKELSRLDSLNQAKLRS